MTVDRFVNVFIRVLTAMADTPDVRIGDLDLLSDEDHAALTTWGTGESLDIPSDSTLNSLLVDQALAHPGRSLQSSTTPPEPTSPTGSSTGGSTPSPDSSSTTVCVSATE